MHLVDVYCSLESQIRNLLVHLHQLSSALFVTEVFNFCLCFVGNSASQAIDLLVRKGVPEDRIIFLNLISVNILAY
jgi:uracil phosphoribosyltransferase